MRNAPKALDTHVLVCLSSVDQAFAAGCAVARAFPLYSMKTGKGALSTRTVYVDFIVDGTVDYARIQV